MGEPGTTDRNVVWSCINAAVLNFKVEFKNSEIKHNEYIFFVNTDPIQRDNIQCKHV